MHTPHLLKSFFRVITVTLLFTTFFYQSWSQSPTAPAQGFNVFLLGDATPINNETEGPVALGGNLVLASSYQVSTNHSGSYTVGGVTVTLLVGGKVIYQSGNGISVNQNGYVKIGDCTGSTVWYTDQNNAFPPIRITPGADYNGSPRINLQANSQQLGVSAVNNPVCQGGLIDFAAAFSQMQASSTGMSSCTDNANLTNANGNAIPHNGLPNQVKINLNSGINILNLAGADMNLVQDFTYNNQPDANHVLVINVNAPGTFNWSVWNSGGIGGQNSPYILYNFYNTTTLNIQGNGAVEGTVFSPFADIVKTANQANIEGQIIAKSYYQNGGENHHFPFTTTVPLCNTTPALSCSAAESHAISCHGGNNGEATVTPAGGSAPYQYLWSNNQTTQTATGLTTGTYNVTVTDDHGATTICSVTIAEPSALNATGVKVDEASALGSDGSIDLTVTGGTSPYSYLWNDGSTDEDRTSLAAGTYSVTVTDAHGCNTTASFEIEEYVCNITVNAGPDVTKCHEGSTMLSASSSDQSATYSWSPVTGLDNPNIANPTTSVEKTTTYTVTVTGADGCTATDDVTVTAYAVVKAKISIKDNTPACAAPCLKLYTPNNPNYSYEWRLNGTAIVGAVDKNTYCACVSGNYSVKVTNTLTGCAHTSKKFEVNIAPKLDGADVNTPMSFTASPNPTSDVINVTVHNAKEGTTTIQLTDMLGRVVATTYSGSISNEQTVTFNMNGLSNGMYLVKIESGNYKEVQKVMLNK